MNLKNSGDSTGFEPMTSAMPVQCSNQLSYEVTQWTAGQFVGLMFARERNVMSKMMLLPALSAGTSTYLLCSSVKYVLTCGSSKIF